jgi:hypothetical protein
VEGAKLNRHPKDAKEAWLIRPNRSDFGSLGMFVRKADGSLWLCIDYLGLNKVTRKYAYPLPRVDDNLDELKDAIFTHTHTHTSTLRVISRKSKYESKTSTWPRLRL